MYIYRIAAVLKVETDIIASIAASPIGRASRDIYDNVCRGLQNLRHNVFYVRLTDKLVHASYELTKYFCKSRSVQ